MARFQAGCVGSRLEVTRLGDCGSGAGSFSAGWRGRVTVRTWSEEERDHYRATLEPHGYSGGRTWTLAAGRLESGRNPAPDVAPCLVRLLGYAVQDANSIADENAARAVRTLAQSLAAYEAEAEAQAEVDRLAGAVVGVTDRAWNHARDVLALATRAAEIAARAVEVANRATARACAEMVRATRALEHAKRTESELMDSDTSGAAVARLSRAAYDAEHEAAAALDAYIAGYGPEACGQAGGECGASDPAGAQATV